MDNDQGTNKLARLCDNATGGEKVEEEKKSS